MTRVSRTVGTAAAHAVDETTDQVIVSATASPAKVRRKTPIRVLAPVIRSKIEPPPLRSSTLSRARLLDKLRECVESRLTFLVAEAGYGKTTLLADFAARSEMRCLWYRLDPSDADVITWTNYLIASAREVDQDFGDKTLALLSQMATGGPPTAVLMASLIAELGQLDPIPTLLVLDDFQSVDTSRDVSDFVGRLLRDAPSWLHITISSRRRPEIEVGRVAATGDLSEIGTTDLRFSREEIATLFAKSYGFPLDDDVVSDVDERTQGWAACLQLFQGSIRGKPSSAARVLARSLSGATRPVYDFLAEEVLANIPPELETFLVRVALLDRVSAGAIGALFGDQDPAPTVTRALRWIEDADRLGLMARSSDSSETRQLHPLLRDYLRKQLERRYEFSEVRAMHRRIADAVRDSDPLTACHHLVEAGCEPEAMTLLGKSVMLTMGSGQWGLASMLIDRLQHAPIDPAVAAIRARRCLDEGDLGAAADLLKDIDLSHSPPDVRAVVRHAKLSLGWRAGDRELMISTLEEIQSDLETPRLLGEIFSIFIDSSPLASKPVALSNLGRRMIRMAGSQLSAGHTYHAAISLHNAMVALVAAGQFAEAVDVGLKALNAFDNLIGVDSERYSTHTVLAVCDIERGLIQSAEEHVREALSTGTEGGDVHAECAFIFAVLGDATRAEQLLLSADALARQGRADLVSRMVSSFTRALLSLPQDPTNALNILSEVPVVMPLDVGHTLDHQTLTCLSLLMSGSDLEAQRAAATGLQTAHDRGARRAETILGILQTLAANDADALRKSLSNAASVGNMAILITADAIGKSLWLVPDLPHEIKSSIAAFPRRWLPVLRRQMDEGASANALLAAMLLDHYGEVADVGRLRAFAKTYRKTVKASWSLGRSLARQLSPRLNINDLGKVVLSVGDRRIRVGDMRRKAAMLVMFLVTRPGFTATREQTLEELWPDADPTSASNNLNQALYYLRRDIDPWYEDDLAVEYVRLQADVVWLDTALCGASSAQFVDRVRECMATPPGPEQILAIIDSYAGQFSPEFEYEEWAMAWRTRVHSHFLEFGSWAIDYLVSRNSLGIARDIAISVLGRDPDAREVERKLVWLYWHLGHEAAAELQYEHMSAQDRADAIEPPRFRDLVAEPTPEP